MGEQVEALRRSAERVCLEVVAYMPSSLGPDLFLLDEAEAVALARLFLRVVDSNSVAEGHRVLKRAV